MEHQFDTSELDSARYTARQSNHQFERIERRAARGAWRAFIFPVVFAGIGALAAAQNANALSEGTLMERGTLIVGVSLVILTGILCAVRVMELRLLPAEVARLRAARDEDAARLERMLVETPGLD